MPAYIPNIIEHTTFTSTYPACIYTILPAAAVKPIIKELVAVAAFIGISENFTLENFKSLLLYLKKLYTDIENQNSSCFLFKDDYVIKSSLETNSSLEVNFFLDDYYTKKEQAEEFTRV